MLTQKKLNSIKKQSNVFAEKMKDEILGLCQELDYKNSSNLSHRIDRLNLFVDELNEFEIQKTNDKKIDYEIHKENFHGELTGDFDVNEIELPF